MNEDNVVREAPRKKRRSLWWLWLLLFLLAFGGGIILGLKLNTLPLPAEMKDRLYPVLESYIPGSTAMRGGDGTVIAPEPTPQITPAPTPVPEATAEPVPTPVPEVIEALVPAEASVPAVEEDAVPEKTLTVEETSETTATDTVPDVSEPAAPEDGKTGAEKKYIGVGTALETALAHAKVEEKDAEVSGVQRAKDEDGNTVYNVSFRSDDFSYEYMIDAVSGEVEGWSKSGFTYKEDMTFAASFTGGDVTEAEAAEAAQETAAAESAPEAAAEPAQEAAVEPIQETAAAPVQEVAAAPALKPAVVEPARERIGEERAKEIAFAHAGVKPESVRYSSAEPEIDHGVEYYDVDFMTATRKFEYEIDAYTGEILAFEQEN